MATIPLGAAPGSVALDSQAHRVYVSLPERDSVLAIDGATRQIVARLPAGRRPGTMVFEPTARRLYVANEDDDDVSVLDARTGATLAALPTGARPGALAIDAARGIAYVGDEGSRADVARTGNPFGTVRVLDLATRRQLAALPVAPVNELHMVGALALDPGCDLAYVAVDRLESGALLVLDTRARRFGAAASLGGPIYGLAVDANLHKVYATAGSGSLAVLPSACDKALPYSPPTIGAGPYPSAVAVDEAAQMVYVADAAGGTVTVVDALADRPVAAVPVGKFPAALAVDAATHLVYVANRGDGTLSVIQGAARQVPAAAAPTRTPAALPATGAGGCAPRSSRCGSRALMASSRAEGPAEQRRRSRWPIAALPALRKVVVRSGRRDTGMPPHRA